ncbi:C40 family peptidase [Deinococcus soli (ex Cha et al. 2016)]|jgi:cell wall-associated NlpC family hydrolase|uniref:Cell wall-associated NlpC family hydrolase n=2 Tax=Deinococcus soli (ex Cha et al. 2016) TaxID=1309411 RepID=A0A0F7JNK9_9DEIO|nr:LysM peptidoglycan-binding domain-containing C40 family peptidase [Deinococcus soli (ex Cha et al. 2016)]AKH16180.1 peptidase [Deinococcus soli (ex Cha et al. 2016)]MDR6216576.1 cell wall-associated NlpC family hydrolase [Deinococcus soli (ex Cha et al. 2016)]MDR6327397.1 cell wall-associated NlpC family hydrolase [Deinococcus soli (ex Cha et al. 2016)]MDR6749672.1 cell wall-associated NlpC family hydrolase [Deinococcus soli (ex Cha et al. 2016)]GGB73471.1 peptidase [Deinococcus soli (ex Ch
MKATRALLTLLALCGTATAASYTVKPGDSLYSIAKKAGVDAPTLMKLNKLPSTTIQVGQTLNLGGTPAPAARPQAAAPAAAPQGVSIRAAATRFLGARYVLGATGGGALDCSSYTMSVFRQLGINLPRTAAQQWRVGSAVSRRDLRAGDLVFFNTMGRTASHVGVYLGDGMMANANSYRGRTVIEPLFANSYWASRYDGARRVLN